MLERPRQAVILAGGRGERLRPLTDTCPKHMVEVAGVPFAEHLVRMLRAQGFDRILFLLGYLPEVTINYFSNRVTYSVFPPEVASGARLMAARPYLESQFLLLYCDSYWPLPFLRMWQHWRESGALAQMTVYENEDGYSAGNVSCSHGLVSKYDKLRSKSGLRQVDIGYLLLSRDALDLLPPGNTGIEALYSELVARQSLAAFSTRHRYYGVGSHPRLALTRAFFDSPETIILDRDGVLNRRPLPGEYVRSWHEWQWAEGARSALRALHTSGRRVIVVSNQAGIARGALSTRDLAEIDRRMKADAREAGGEITASYYCPHHWDDHCPCRKPAPGMLFQAQRDFHIDLSKTLYVGDDSRDSEPAEAAGCLYAEVNSTRTLLDIVKENQSQWVNAY